MPLVASSGHRDLGGRPTPLARLDKVALRRGDVARPASKRVNATASTPGIAVGGRQRHCRTPRSSLRKTLTGPITMSQNLFGRSGGLLGAIPNSVKAAAVALLVQQLLKHSQAAGTQSGGTPGGTAPAQGGLGGLLGGLLGGGAASPMAGDAAGGGLGGLLGGLLGGSASPMSGGGGGGLGGLLGGLGGLLGGLRSQGLGRQVDSWVASGPNQEISPQDLESSIDPQDLDEAARHAGTDRASVLAELSGLLPQFVNQATPQGSLPQHEGELGAGGLAGMMDKLLGSSGEQEPGGAVPSRGL